MNGFMNIIPEDIVERLYRRRAFWFNGPPKVTLLGLPGSFGVLAFDFGEDDLVKYRIRITDRDRLLAVAQDAIDNFKPLAYAYFEQKY